MYIEHLKIMLILKENFIKQSLGHKFDVKARSSLFFFNDYDAEVAF